jgi:hypothetical protein
MKKTVLFLLSFVATVSFAQNNCSDLFISEYVEGWSNNKALEIYNPTGNSINLSGYFVARYSNGSSSATVANAVQLTGVIAPYSVHVAVLEKLDPNGTGQGAPVWDSLVARADAFYCPVYNTSNAFYWNGNDAILLAKGTLPASSTANVTTSTGFAIVDIFGKIGENPANETGVSSGNDGAWSTAFPYSTGLGVQVTKDHSMIRKSAIQKGVNTQVSFFNPLEQWDTIPGVIVRLDANGDTLFGNLGNPILDGNWASLGTHTCSCNPSSSVNTIAIEDQFTVYPNPTSGVIYVKGLANVDRIQLINSLGQQVASYNQPSKQLIAIDLSAHKGVYFLKMTTDSGEQITKRIIVK